MAEAQETEFTKFLDKHKEYPSCYIITEYLALSMQGNSREEIFRIIEKKKIPEYIKEIREEAKKWLPKTKVLSKIEKFVGIYF